MWYIGWERAVLLYFKEAEDPCLITFVVQLSLYKSDDILESLIIIMW